MIDKLLELTILALKNGNTLDQVANFINLLNGISIQETKSVVLAEGNIE